MKYSRMLFLPQNDTLIVNILPVIEHSVKNKEKVKFPGHFWNMDGHTSPSGESAKLTSVIETGSGGFCCYLIEWRRMVSFQTFQYFVYFGRFSYDGDDSHFMRTFWTDQRIDLIHLYQSSPALSWSFVRCRFCITLGRLFMFYILSSFRLVTELCKTSIFVCFPFCSAGIQTVVTDQVPLALVVYAG